MNFRNQLLVLFSLVVFGCKGPIGVEINSKIDSNFFDKKDAKVPKINNVTISGENLKLTGTDIDSVKNAEIEINGTKSNLVIKNKNSSEINLSTAGNLFMVAGQIFKVFLKTANAQAVILAQFEIADGSITTNKLNGPLSGSGVSNGQVLSWSGSAWVPVNLTSGIDYKGTYNANTNTPDIANLTNQNGDFYIVSSAGSQDLGSGNVSLNLGDWVMYSNGSWDVLPSTNSVSSVFGRTGAVTAQNNDYTWAQINKITSSIGDIADVDLSTSPNNGEVLMFNGTSWIPGVVSSTPTAGSITNSMLAGSIDQSKITGLVSALSSKEGVISTGTNSQYFRGDKTWRELNTDAVTEGTNLYFTDARAISALATTLSNYVTSSSLSTGLSGKENSISTGTNSQYFRGDKTWRDLNTDAVTEGTNLYFTNTRAVTAMSGADINGVVFPGSPAQTLIVPLAPVSFTDAVNKQYVDNKIDSNGVWTKATNDIYFSNKVTIGGSTIEERLTVNGNIKATGQIYSGVYTDTTGQINFSSGNTATTNYNCSGSIQFTDLFPGTAYAFVNTNTGTTKCDFNTTVLLSTGGTQTVSYRFIPTNDLRASNSHTVYSLMRINNIVYVNWTTGY